MLIESFRNGPTWYGTPASSVESGLQAGEDVIAKIDVNGAAALRARYPRTVSIFLAPGSADELWQRMTSRDSELESERLRRFAVATEEIDRAPEFDYLVINRDGCAEAAVQEVRAIIAAERARIDPD